MTTRALVPSHAGAHLERLLVDHPALDHLAVKRRGRSLTLCSEDAYGLTHHAKFEWLGAEVWGLSLPTHTGRWERTPFTGSLDDLLHTLIQTLPFHLAPR